MRACCDDNDNGDITILSGDEKNALGFGLRISDFRL
jgi:hypothetical protein